MVDELIKQVPAAAAIIIVVVYFLRHLTMCTKDSREERKECMEILKNQGQEFKESVDSFRVTMAEVAGELRDNTSVMRDWKTLTETQMGMKRSK